MVVLIIGIAVAGVSLALPNSGQTRLDKEAQRLVALLESARARSRASGVPVVFRFDSKTFSFEGLPDQPQNWLSDDVLVGGSSSLLLGPEPIIGAQGITLSLAASNGYSLSVATDGLRPFEVATADRH